MPVVTYGKRDLLRDKLVTPGWYRVLIENVDEWQPSKDRKSQNMVLEGTILFNAENGSKEFADIPIGGMGTWNFNTKAMGFSLGLTRAMAKQCGYSPEDITENTKIEFKNCEGKQIDVFIINDSFEGRLKNKVDHKYKEPDLSVSA